MAVNKRKILESAQKFLQKGALDKALKEYQSLLEVDPRDSGARLKLGDIHLRLGKKDEAVAAYLKVAHQFMKDGFDAKAVALFKQIAKLAPEQIEIYVPLAELYQRLGLTSEAMAALQTATEGFQKAGRKREALELLRKAAALDPTNTTSRLKIADLLRQQGMTAEALNEYDEVAVELERNGEEDALAAVYERVLEIEPNRVPALIALARASLRTGANERAHELAERAARDRPDLIEALEVYSEALQAVGRDVDEADLRRLADLHRARGNEGRAREILQRLMPAYDLTLNGVESSAPRPPSDVDVLEDLTQAGARLGPASAVGASPPPSKPSAAAPAPARPEAPVVARPAPQAAPGESDVEQLLAEAGVYLRFGKRDKAIASLEAVLAQCPDHAAAREKLAAVLAESGAVARVAPIPAGSVPDVSVSSPAPELELAPGPEIDDATPQQATAASEPAMPQAPEFEFEVELDLSGGDEVDIPVELANGPQASSSGFPGALGSEIELGADAALEDLVLAAADDRSAAQPEAREIAPEMEIPSEEELAASFRGETNPPEGLEPAPEIEELPRLEELAEEASALADVEPIALDDEVESEPLPPLPPALPSEPVHRGNPALSLQAEQAFVEAAEPEGARTPSVTASPKQILEDLEEGDFYYHQGLLDEAAAVYRRVLEVAPTNPQALLRLGEIAAARGHDPGAEASDAGFAFSPEESTQPGVETSSAADIALGDDLADWDDTDSGDEASTDPGEVTAAGHDFDASFVEEERVAAAAEPTEEASPDFTEESAAPSFRSADGDGTQPVPIADPQENSLFDLAAELSEDLDHDGDAVDAEPVTPVAPEIETETEESLEAIFSEFKRGVRKTLTAADHETHYDLGIAYREMGLLEDAMSEFQIALESPARHLDCLQLLGLCARESKRPGDAVAFFQQALSTADVSAERRAAIGFELGVAFEEAGDAASALEALGDVATLAPDFPGLQARIDALQAMRALASTDEEVAPAASDPAEVFESFDDLIADAEAEFANEEVEEAAAAPVSPSPAASRSSENPEDPAPPPTPPRGTSSRRRKVSFG